MTDQQRIEQELQEAASVLDTFLRQKETTSLIARAASLMASAVEDGGKIISCGNGGSHCDAMHFAEELTGKYRNPRKAIPAICISDASHITCVGNDYGYDSIFSRYLEALGNEGDVLFALSTSGQSANVIKAAETARQRGMKVVALTGKDGGKLADLADVEIRVPHDGFADRIQEIHIKVIHILILLIEGRVG
jgi:D-sedoheptulose 7-phosphate isomerase